VSIGVLALQPTARSPQREKGDFQRVEFVFSGNECSPNNEHEHEQLNVRVRVRFSAGQVYCSLFVFVSLSTTSKKYKKARRQF
jgi:hypothetical protein